jgi:hypothetical protein
MGTWGIESFHDDIAVDWLEDLFDSDPIAFFRQCLDLTGHDYLGHIACIGVVCTAEMIHGVLSEPRAGLPEAALQWLKVNQDLNVKPFVYEAIIGLGRVIGPESEMFEMWQDSENQLDAWQTHLRELVERLEVVAAEIS